MVFSRDIKQIVKKGKITTSQDKKDWDTFTKEDMGNVSPKEKDTFGEYSNLNKIRKLDLHGFSLDNANKYTKKFIKESYDKKYKKLLIVTGKGLRSKLHDNPYVSEELNVLKNSVPEFIKNNQELSEKINKISKASQEDGGDGAFYVFLKN